MPKETDTEETLGLVVFIFSISEILMGRAGLVIPFWLPFDEV